MKRIFNFPTNKAAYTVLILLMVIFASCGGSSGTSSATDSSTGNNSASNSPTADLAKENWQYSQDSDKMTSKIKYYASVDATEQLQLKAPYDGGVTATVIVRNSTGENEVLVKISKGQFLASIDGENIQVRFDTAKAETYSCVGPSDYSSTMLFIQSPAKFISNLKKAKKLLIGAEMYDNGVQQMEFNVDGLKWNH